MTAERSFTGQLEFLGRTIDVSAVGYTDNDGSEVRDLQLHRPPLRPTELLQLMCEVAPDPQPPDLRDIKIDLSIAVNPYSFMGEDYLGRVLSGHRRAFGHNWSVLEDQAQTIYDALPYRYTDGRPNLRYPFRSVIDAIASIDKKTVRDELSDQYRRGETLAAPFQIADSSLIAPKTPFIQLQREDGTSYIVKRASLAVHTDVAPSTQLGLTPDGLAHVAISKMNHRYPLWETLTEPNLGVEPLIRWRVYPDGVRAFEHQPLEERDVIHNGENWHAIRSSVIGCVALAAMTPLVTEFWSDRGTYDGATRDQKMGPLQAVLLSMLAANSFLHDDLVGNIEEALTD